MQQQFLQESLHSILDVQGCMVDKFVEAVYFHWPFYLEVDIMVFRNTQQGVVEIQKEQSLPNA